MPINYLRQLIPLFQPQDFQGKYTELRPDLILKTIENLEHRIGERFPEAGLRQVCNEFLTLAHKSESVARELRHPIWIVRVASFIAGTLLLGLVFWAMSQLARNFTLQENAMPELVQTTESAINELIFLGLALYTLVNLEARLKRTSALKALHQMRSIAHVVDMHQLTKDPAHLLSQANGDTDTQNHKLNEAQLTRYLEYCSELLALIAKIAALFVQNTDDGVVLNAVNDIEELAQGLSAKIWQKIMILDLARE